MEQHVANAISLCIFPEWTIPADAYIPVCVKRFDWRCVGSHDPDVDHIAGLTIQARPDEAGRYGNDRCVVDEAWAFIEHDAVVVASCPLGADNVQLFSQLNDLSIELFQLCADFFLRRYDRSLLSR